MDYIRHYSRMKAEEYLQEMEVELNAERKTFREEQRTFEGMKSKYSFQVFLALAKSSSESFLFKKSNNTQRKLNTTNSKQNSKKHSKQLEHELKPN